MGRPSAYSAAICDRIIEVIEQCGCVKTARAAVKLAESTFYDWRIRYPEFSERIKKAQEKYRMERVPADLVELANKRLREYLEGGAKERFVKNGATLDPEGKVISRFVSETQVTRPTPQWAIERVLGPAPKPLGEIEAMQQLVIAGMASEESLTALIEGVDAIKSRLREINSANQKAIADGNGQSINASSPNEEG